MVAALSANHLAALLFPPTLRRLYVARDRDPAGDAAMASLIASGRELPGSRRSACRPASTISTRISAGWVSTRFRASVRQQLAPQDVVRFMTLDDDRDGMTTGTANRFVVGRLDALRIGRGRAPAF